MNTGLEQSSFLYTPDKPTIVGTLLPSNGDCNSATGGDWPDLTLISSDQAIYLVHLSQTLSRVSNNAFAGFLIGNNKSITLPEPASTLDLVVNIAYGLSCAHLTPSLEVVEATLEALVKYGIPPPLIAYPGQPLHELILLHAPYRPIEVYALAGHHGLEDAAVTISGHLLFYDTSQLSDELIVKMGPVYFRRLVDLHQGRLAALKSIILRPPTQHPPTPACGEGSYARARLKEAWAHALAQLVWDTSPGISIDSLRRSFEIASDASVRCDDCSTALQMRIAEVCEAWAVVKRTI